MLYTHPKRKYFIGLLKQQHDKHEAKHVGVSKGLSPCAAEFIPQDQNSGLHPVLNCSSANNHPISVVPSPVSSVHVVLSVKATRLQAVEFVAFSPENIVLNAYMD
jgi:hypothetical protein